MRIIHYFLLIICLSFVSVDSFSKQVNLSQAESIAKQFHSFLYPQTRATDATCELVYTGKLSATSPSFYVFNYEAGFVMVAGDDLSTPVLAYSPSNQFVATNLPCNITYWLDGYEQQIASLRDETGDAHPGWDNLSILFSTTRDASSDKLYSTALWYQYTPYNKYCPTVDGSGTATGCVATAFSIAMKYREWPDTGTGSYSYVWDKETLSANFDVTYQWSEMLHEYTSGNYTEAQGDAVATLMYHIGVLSEMDYGVSGSGAHTINAVVGVAKYMKYDKSIMRLNRSWYAIDEWVSMIKTELNDNGPMVYGGYDTTEGGHQFILDGYQNDYFHVNWGWGGSSDGYYLITDLNPFDRKATSGGFANEQGGVFNLKPETANSSYTYLWVFGEDTINDVDYVGLTAATTDIKQGVEFNVAAGVYFNQSLVSFTGEMCIMLCDKDGTPKEDVSGLYSINDFPSGQGSFHTFVCKITQAVADGDYICMMYKTSGTDTWQMIIGGSGITTKLYPETSTNIQLNDADNSCIIENNGSALVIQSDIAIIGVSIYSASGEWIDHYTFKGDKSIQIDINDLIKGVYLLQIQTKEGIGNYKFNR